MRSSNKVTARNLEEVPGWNWCGESLELVAVVEVVDVVSLGELELLGHATGDVLDTVVE